VFDEPLGSMDMLYSHDPLKGGESTKVSKQESRALRRGRGGGGKTTFAGGDVSYQREKRGCVTMKALGGRVQSGES